MDCWQLNQNIIQAALTEDFVTGESIQSIIGSGAIDSMLFGRFEGAVDQFNQKAHRYLW